MLWGMFYTHLLLLSVLSAPVTGVSDVAAPPTAGWYATLQLGAGFLAEDAAMLLRPHVGFTDERGEVTLSAPRQRLILFTEAYRTTNLLRSIMLK